jgi:hypothetical protein
MPAVRSDEAVLKVLARCARDGLPCCEVCGEPINGLRGYDWAVHHRRFRDGASDQDTPQNTLVVCGGSNVDRCHGVIHSGKTYAKRRGWAITRHGNQDPLLQPMLIDHESRWVYLTADGEYADNPPEVVV